MATGDPGRWMTGSRKTSCPPRVLGAAALQGFSRLPLLASPWGAFGMREKARQCNGRGASGSRAILGLPLAPPDNCPLGVVAQGPLSSHGYGGCSPELSHFFPGSHLGLWWCRPSPEVRLFLRLDPWPEQFARDLSMLPIQSCQPPSRLIVGTTRE